MEMERETVLALQRFQTDPVQGCESNVSCTSYDSCPSHASGLTL